MIDRKVRPLERLVNTYHTVEKLKFDEEEQPKQEQPKVNDETQKQRTELYNLINKVVEIFGKVDKEVEYVVDNGKVTAELYIAPPLSLSDITSLEENSEKYNFKYEAITEKQKIKKNGRNSLILISLLDEGEKIDEHRRNN